jgi:isopenicillin-N N-acyltransferase-like protein
MKLSRVCVAVLVLWIGVVAWAEEAGSSKVAVSRGEAQTIARCGEGWLETIDGYPVVHLKGTPYEMGFQHGALLKESARANMGNIATMMAERQLVKFGPLQIVPKDAVKSIQSIQNKFVPKHFFEEMEGLAAGTEMPVADIQAGNFLPELFHCSGFAIMNSATKDGTLYHGRVLDYAIDWGLQEHAVIVVAEPTGGIPFVNVTYAGFIGCVTGMNAEHVSIGEMGGGGIGHWAGVPMAFLVREALESGKSLEEALAVFEKSPRTCQYYYVVADGETNEAVGMEASWNRFEVIRAGQPHKLLPDAVQDCALLSAGDRYRELVRRTKEGHGTFTPESALRLMDRGVAMKSNLHNVLFEPKTTRFWVSNAGADKQPAAERPYQAFQLSELLKRKPNGESKEIPLVTQK